MLRQNRMNPSFEKPSLDDVFLILLDCDCRLSDAQNARGFARRGTDATREFREVVGRVQLTACLFPVSSVNMAIPVRNKVADWTSPLTEPHPPVPASRPPLATPLSRQIP